MLEELIGSWFRAITRRVRFKMLCSGQAAHPGGISLSWFSRSSITVVCSLSLRVARPRDALSWLTSVLVSVA